MVRGRRDENRHERMKKEKRRKIEKKKCLDKKDKKDKKRTAVLSLARLFE